MIMAKINQQLIADRLNLSRTTVSRCFTHNPRINPETRAKVFECAAQLGYKYHAPRGTEAINDKDTDRIVVLLGAPSPQEGENRTAEALLKGISQQVAADGLSMEVHYVDPATFHPKPRSRRILDGISTKDWRGLIMIYPFDETAVDNLMRKFPMISLLENYDNEEVDCIDTDHVRGISQLIDHLIGLGHQKIGYLSWKYRVPAHWVERRFGAYVESLYRHDLDLDPSLVLNVKRHQHIHESKLPDMVIEHLKRGVHAWVCAADHQAIELIKGLQERGIRVPEDISITGYDGIPVPDGIPSLTSVQMAFTEIGQSSIVSLQRRMLQPNTGRRNVHVSGKLVIGKSTAPPPQ